MDKDKCEICKRDNVELEYAEEREDQNFKGGFLCSDCKKNLDFYREMYETPKIATRICGKCGLEGELIHVEEGDVPSFGSGFICSACYKELSEKRRGG